MKIPNCPKCGSPMKLESLGNSRVYKCIRGDIFYCSKNDYCDGSIFLDPKKNISVSEISENLALDKYVRSEDRIKEQTSLKKVETGLVQIKDRYKRFLSEKEIKNLELAQKITQKLYSAVEKSKRVVVENEKRKRIENEKADRKILYDIANTFLAGLTKDEIILKCEIVNKFINQNIRTPLESKIYFYQKDPSEKNLKSLKLEVAREIDSNDLDTTSEKYKRFSESYLHDIEVSKRRESFKIIKE